IGCIYRNGDAAGEFTILESLGGGVAVLDADRDGLEDLYFTGGGEIGPGPELRGRSGALYRGRADQSWHDHTDASGLLASRFYSHGALRGDYDSDGFPDLLVTGYGGLQLYQNHGDGTFDDVTDAAGLSDHDWSSSAGWGDFDRDGMLDLFVVHYVDWSFANHPFCPGPTPGSRDVCPPREFRAQPDQMWFSQGDGQFQDRTALSEIRDDGKGLGVLIADLDDDADLDVYVANDTVDNHLYRNEGEGRLEDATLVSGAGVSDRGFPDGSMGVGLLDFDGNGRLDLWVVNYERESNALYRNQGGLLFQHASVPTGITAAGGMYVGWGTCCGDFDLDADEDLFVSNGHVVHFPERAPVMQQPLLLENQSGRRFSIVTAVDGYLAEAHHGRGAACGDFNRDGRLDIAVSRNNQPAAVLINQVETDGHWFQLRLVGTESSRDAVGARLRVRTSAGDQHRQWIGGGSYASTHSDWLHFGLGAATRVEELQIDWPSGNSQVLTDLPVDRRQIVVEAFERTGNNSGWTGGEAPLE
ncbi:MAG: CRTAC1 family protein, partial [Planctomycetaceae bacterium]|nr:CRTAC1 family protein [Planctomycetaceae bacterium]